VGEPNRGIEYMFQMMNEARINIGIHGVATASVAYRTALDYAVMRQQGRPAGAAASSEPVSILAHSDVRRMLLRQKAIVEGGLALVLTTARYQDVALHGQTAAVRERAQRLLDLLTPVAKTFPAEHGFEANALALQIHGGYGYTSEYLPEAWLRDQKLNSIHEGTTGIQSLDLLGRKVIKTGGQAVALLAEEIAATQARALAAGVSSEARAAVAGALNELLELSRALVAVAQRDPEAALRHSADYMQAFSTTVIGWMWLLCAAVAEERLRAGHPEREHCEGKRCAAEYWFRTELPRVRVLSELCLGNDDSYARMQASWF
jgi:butyryl-CoA dehydrogenase